MNKTIQLVFTSLAVSCSLLAQSSLLSSSPVSAAALQEGIPITSELVQKSCVQCHRLDEQNRMSRISYRRTTPEGWQLTIKRMVSLNETKIEPEEARLILKYLANNLGLAPEEARPAAFEVERRLIHHEYADRLTEQVCTKCHSMGRVMAQRRTQPEWELLIAMHRGYYPHTDYQGFRLERQSEAQSDADKDDRHPMEKAVAHLSEAFPLVTPEWLAWSANMRPPRLEGRWALSGRQPGKGPIYGEVTITAGPQGEDEFVTEARYVYSRSGQAVERNGKAVVYTGFQWRGRSFEGSDEGAGLREVMFVERDWKQIWGRWFTGAYDEIGMDVQLERVSASPVVLGVEPSALKISSEHSDVRIYGLNLPRLSPGDIDLGPGIKVSRVNRSGPGVVVIQVQVAPDARLGARDLFLAGATRTKALAVFDKVDVIRVLPQAGMARLGGANFSKQYQQFEAVAYHNGPDRDAGTQDDLNLGIVDVAWSLEEYPTRFGDDDRNFVGTIDGSGLFTPNLDGPNPERHHGTNNYGDVWVVATYQEESSDQTLRARAHLLVTVPLYVRWDQSEVGP